jgi:hypothetical protein
LIAVLDNKKRKGIPEVIGIVTAPRVRSVLPEPSVHLIGSFPNVVRNTILIKNVYPRLL